MKNPGPQSVVTNFKFKAFHVAISLGLLGSVSLQAQTWDGGGADNNWTTAGNWTANVAPVATNSLTFDGVLRLAAANDFTAATQFNGLTFAASAGGFTLSGNSITLGGNIVDNSLNAQIISAPLILNADRSVNVSLRNGAVTVSSVISGSGNTLIKTGSGLLTLSGGTNTFTNLTVNGGTVSVAGDGNLGSTTGTINLNGGNLRTSAGITLTSTRGISLGSATAGTGGTIDAAAGTTIYGGVLANNGGTNSFTKTGAGQLNLTGVNTYTGETRINQGTVLVDRNGGGSINSASALVLGGNNTSLGATSSVSNAVNAPTLLVQAASAVDTQTFNGLTLNQGNSAIAFRSIGATADTLALGSITRNPGGFINITRLKDLVGSANALVTTSTANTSGILGGWAVTNADAAVGGVAVAAATDWAANDGSGNIVAYAGYTVPTGATPALVSNAASNVRIDGTSTGNLSLSAGTTDLNTIQMTDTVARTIAVGSGNTLRLGANGGVWKTQGINGTQLTIGSNDANRGTLTAGGADNNAGEIVFNTNSGNTANNGVIVNSVIANNGTGVVSITKTGQGSMDLVGANTYTGNTYINQGRLATSNLSLGSIGGNGTTTGSGTVFIQPSGQLFLAENATRTVANNIVVAGAGTAENGSFGAIRFGNTTTVGTSTSSITLAGDARFGRNTDTSIATLAGKITGDYNLELTAANQGTEANRNVFVISNTGNDMGGNLGINAVNLGAGQTAANNGNSSVQVRLGASEVIANGAGKGNVFIGGSATAANNSYLDLNGFNETINGLVSVGTAAQTHVTNGRSGTPGTATLTLGDGNATASFGGIIENGTGTTALTKIGLGTQTLGGANTYTGTTTVSAGTLLISSTGSLNSSSYVISNGGKMDVSAKTSFSLASAPVTFGLSDTTSGFFDGGTTTALTFGNALTLNFSTASLINGTNYNLFDMASQTGDFSTVGLSGSFASSLSLTGADLWTGSEGGFNFSFNEATGVLSVAAIPEPSTYAMFGMGLLSLWALRRKSKKV